MTSSVPGCRRRDRRGDRTRISVLASVVAYLALAPSAPAAAERFQLSGVTPSAVELEPGGTARLALTGHELQLLKAPQAHRGGRDVTDLDLRLGPARPALRDLFVRADPAAAAGEYTVSITVNTVTATLPVLIRVAPSAAASRHDQRGTPLSPSGAREQIDSILRGR